MKATKSNLTLLGLQERGLAATERPLPERKPSPIEQRIEATMAKARELPAPGSKAIGKAELCLDCMLALDVDDTLQTWVCRGCARSGGYATASNGWRVRVSFGGQA